MRRYGTLLAVGLTIALSSGLTPAAGAAHAADDDCAAVVQDQAGVLSAEQVNELTDYAAPLTQTTELRIRTVTSTNGETLNTYEEAEQKSCGWADAANVRQPRLLVIMVATEDRRVGIYPGPALVATLTDSVWLTIEQENMRPLFAAQDWMEGLDAGVDALQEVLAKGAPPATAPAPTAAGLPTAGPIRYDANGNIIQGDGSQEHPFVSDPNGILPGSQNGIGASGSNSSALFGVFFGIVAVLVVVGIIVGVVKGGGSGRSRGYRGADGVWIGGIDPLQQQHQQHHPGVFGGGGGFGAGGGGGDTGGGGGGSSSDGGGGSSGF